MDNISKVIVMAGQVMVFLTAASIGIMLYTTLINTQNVVLTSSENFSQRAERASLWHTVFQPSATATGSCT